MNKKKLTEFNKSVILDAAKKLFGEKGVEGTAVDEIAREADCSKATLYAYFKSKDDIYYHIVLECVNALYNGVKERLANTEDHERSFFSLCDFLVDIEKEYSLYFTSVFENIGDDRTDELPVLKQIKIVLERINEIICEFIETAKSKGFARPDIDSEQGAFIMWSSLCGLIALGSGKRGYIEGKLKLTKDEFLKSGFSVILLILRMIKFGRQ